MTQHLITKATVLTADAKPANTSGSRVNRAVCVCPGTVLLLLLLGIKALLHIVSLPDLGQYPICINIYILRTCSVYHINDNILQHHFKLPML